MDKGRIEAIERKVKRIPPIGYLATALSRTSPKGDDWALDISTLCSKDVPWLFDALRDAQARVEALRKASLAVIGTAALLDSGADAQQWAMVPRQLLDELADVVLPQQPTEAERQAKGG